MNQPRLIGGRVTAEGDEGKVLILTDTGKTVLAAAPPSVHRGQRVVVDLSGPPTVISPSAPESP